jgi:hypothetical protein
MVGGGNRRDEGSLVIKNTNVFAALETLRKKKKKSSDKTGSKSQAKEPEQPRVFWAPAPLTTKSWADVDDEDDDDYYATTAPPQSIWGASESDEAKEKKLPAEESESEEDILDEGDEEEEEEHDQLPEETIQMEPMENKAPEVPSAPKEAERQLSKKEIKKKELAELEALLADFGVSPKVDNTPDESQDVTREMKDGEANGNDGGEKKGNVPTESKVAKKKKKKDKSSKEVKEPQDQLNSTDVTTGPEETAGTEHAEEDASSVDVKERLKRMASAKKKKSNKELDGAARAAATEAAARSARLAAAKKKEKNHYNQQPVR